MTEEEQEPLLRAQPARVQGVIGDPGFTCERAQVATVDARAHDQICFLAANRRGRDGTREQPFHVAVKRRRSWLVAR